MTIFRPCEIHEIYQTQRDKLLLEQEHKYADEEQKAILRLKKKKELEDKLKRKQKEASNYVEALRKRDARQYGDAIPILNVLVKDNPMEIRFILLRCYLNYGLKRYKSFG